jgi:hypothetical protein
MKASFGWAAFVYKAANKPNAQTHVSGTERRDFDDNKNLKDRNLIFDQPNFS